MEDAAKDNQLRIAKIRKSQNRGPTDSIWNQMSSGSRLGLTRIIGELYSSAQGWVVLAIIGIIIGIIAAFINIVTEWLSDIKTGHCTVGFYLNREFCCSGYEEDELCREWRTWAPFSPANYLIYVIISTLLAFVSAFIVYSFAPYAAGSGISEIKCIIAGFVMKGFLGARTLVIKSLTLPLAIGSGLSVGKEGPSVHYATCVGNTVASRFEKYRNHSAKLREILCACTAAGVAVAFGSPMGGVLFSLEEISATFQLKTMWRSYFCSLVAIGALAMMNPFRTGQLVLFSVKFDYKWQSFEVFYFLLIGVLGGVYGIVVSKWNFRAQAFRKKYLGKYAVEEATFLAFITAILCYFNRFLRIDMTESMQLLFRECNAVQSLGEDSLCNPRHRAKLIVSLLYAIIVRTLLVIISYGSKVPAGIFVPSMAVGALMGRFVGAIAEAIHQQFPTAAIFSQCPPEGPCIIPGTYAFLGAASALSGIMNLTVTVVVVMFELTGALNYILPTMIVVGATKAVSERWGKGGIADQAIWFNGYPYITNKEELHGNAMVSAAMTTDVTTLPDSGLSIQQINTIIENSPHPSYPIVDEQGYLAGYVNRDRLSASLRPLLTQAPDRYVDFTSAEQEDGMGSVKLQAITFKAPIVCAPSDKLHSIIEVFTKLGPRVIYVQQNDLFKGLVTRKDVLRYKFKSEHVLFPKDTAPVDEMDKKIWESMQEAGRLLQRAFHTLRTWRSE